MPERLEQDEQHENQPEQAGLEAGLLDELIHRQEGGAAGVLPERRGQRAHPGRNRVAGLRDGHRQKRHEDGAEERAVKAAEATDDHHQEKLDREQHGEDIRRQEADLVGEERAGDAHQRGGVGEGGGLVDGEVHAHRLRRDLAVPDRDPGSARRRPQEVAGQPQRDDQEGQTQEVERGVAAGMDRRRRPPSRPACP